MKRQSVKFPWDLYWEKIVRPQEVYCLLSLKIASVIFLSISSEEVFLKLPIERFLWKI